MGVVDYIDTSWYNMYMNWLRDKGTEPSADSMAAWEQQARAAFAEYGYGSGDPDKLEELGRVAVTFVIVAGGLLQGWRDRHHRAVPAAPDARVIVRPAEPGDESTETTVVTGTVESE